MAEYIPVKTLCEGSQSSRSPQDRRAKLTSSQLQDHVQLPELKPFIPQKDAHGGEKTHVASRILKQPPFIRQLCHSKPWQDSDSADTTESYCRSFIARDDRVLGNMRDKLFCLHIRKIRS